MKKEDLIIQIDTREQHPWEIKGYDSITKKLDVGDYAIVGSNILCIERKSSVSEFYKDLVSKKKKFFDKMQRLSGFDRGLIVCEFSYQDLMKCPVFYTKPISPFYILKSIWEIYLLYGVPTFCFENRELAQSFVKSLIKRASEQL